MDFKLSEQQKLLKETARKFAENELLEISKEIEKNNIPPDKDLRIKFAKMGFLGINLSSDYGGAGLSHFDAVLGLE